MAQTSLLTYFQNSDEHVLNQKKHTSSPAALQQNYGARTHHPMILDDATRHHCQTPDELHSTKDPAELPLVPVSHIPHAYIARVTAAHLESLKRLTSSTLPVKYPDKFYLETVEDRKANDLARLVLYDLKPVGWIRCRLEPVAHSVHQQIYIQTLCILAPYRSCGLAACLLDSILASDVVRKNQVTSIYAHVWESNEDALQWYQKRMFKRIMLVHQYYRRLKPAGAWLVRRDLS